jgi:hypothetical protein
MKRQDIRNRDMLKYLNLPIGAMERYEQALKRGPLGEMWRKQLPLTGKRAYVVAFNTDITAGVPNTETLDRQGWRSSAAGGCNAEEVGSGITPWPRRGHARRGRTGKPAPYWLGVTST